MKKIIGFDQEFDSILNQLLDSKLSNSLLLSGNKGIGKKYFISQLIEEYIKKKVVSEQTHHHLSLLKNHSHPNFIIVKKEIDEEFSSINTHSFFYVKKSIRKILRNTKKYIRYSKKKETEAELLLYFCQSMILYSLYLHLLHDDHLYKILVLSYVHYLYKFVFHYVECSTIY